MVAYSIFLNFVEVFTLTTFVYLYYSFSSRKQFCLLLTSLFLICELCDIFKENGGVLMSLYFLICLFHIFYNKHDIHFGDIFILGCYVFLIFIYPFLFFSLFKPLLTAGYVYLFYLLAGFISKIILISFTYWLVKHFKYNITVPNKQYSLVIIIEIIILGVLVIVGYSTINTSADYSPFIICFLLIIVFILIIANGIYFNMVYTEKMQYEKKKNI